MREKESTEYKIKKKGVRILVVDDDPAIRELLQEMLSQKKDYAVQVARDGKEALLKVRKESFELVLTDLGMPQMDGIQLLKELRKEDCGMKVIVITGTDYPDTATELSDVGAYDYIVKPFHVKGVLQKVTSALRNKASGYAQANLANLETA